MNTIHLSTLRLAANALHASQADQMRKTQPVIRTIKFRIADPKPGANNEVHLPEKEKKILDGLFDAFEQWRKQKVLKVLNAEFDGNAAKFLAATAKRSRGYYNTLFVKGKKEEGLTRVLRTCYAFALPQEMKSFRTRFENEVEKIRKTYEKNFEDWQETMLSLFTENGESQPPPPTPVNAFEPWRKARERLKKKLKELRDKKSGTATDWNDKRSWIAITTRGGGRGGEKKAKRGSSKETMRLKMWHANDHAPLELPLAFGKRQGRKFLWNYDFSLLKKSSYEWELGEAKLLRDKPANGSETKYYLTVSLQRTIPAAALKDKLERFAEKDQAAQFDILGADRGETVPLAYALVAPDGSSLMKADRFAEFQKKFNHWRDAITIWEASAKKEGVEKVGHPPRFQISRRERDQMEESEVGKEKLAAWNKWLWESQPDDGFGVIEPEHHWRMMRIGLEKADFQRQFATWSSELRKKEKEIARALTGKVVRTILDVGSKRRTKFVLESLTSAIVTRGGKDSRMSQRPYERILSTLEFRLNEAGMYRQPKDERKFGSYHLRFIGPHFTSQTCSRCGLVHDSRFYRTITSSLRPSEAKDRWVVTINGSERELRTEFTVYSRRTGEKTIQTKDELPKLLNGESPQEILKPNKDGKLTRAALRLVSTVEKCLPYREKQHIFRCLTGCEPIHADVQAALNIARKFVFQQRVKSGKPGGNETEVEESEVASSFRDDWQEWYQKMVKVWHK